MFKMPIYLYPAYGRSYRGKKDLFSDWKDGKDFQLDDGRYCSIRDIDALKEHYNVYIFCKPNGKHFQL